MDFVWEVIRTEGWVYYLTKCECQSLRVVGHVVMQFSVRVFVNPKLMLLLVRLQQVRALEARAPEHSLWLPCRFVLRVSLVLDLKL